MIAVTPSLYVGKPEDTVYFSDLHWADTVIQATNLIEGGHSALIAEDNWEERVYAILTMLGAKPDTVEWAINTAPRVNEPKES